MGAFRKRPVVIQAYRRSSPTKIVTLEGEMLANAGDWVITGVDCEIYPCKDDIFRKTYEPLDDEAVREWYMKFAEGGSTE